MRPVRERLALLIKEIGITQSEVARRLGEDRKWVHMRLHGSADIEADEIPLFAKALRVPITAFFADEESSRPAKQHASATLQQSTQQPATRDCGRSERDYERAELLLKELVKLLDGPERMLAEGMLALRRTRLDAADRDLLRTTSS